MSNKIGSLKDLLIEQGRELYDASRQEQKELPNIEKQARNQQLKKIINRQLKTSKDQHKRLQQAFKQLNANPEGEKNSCCESILRQTQGLINRSQDPEVRDAAIINSIQRLNHNKITGYGSLISYAKETGQDEIARSLHTVMEDERSIDEDLSELAEREVNKKAAGEMAL